MLAKDFIYKKVYLKEDKLKTHNPDLLSPILYQKTGLSHQLYIHAEEIEDKEFIKKMLTKFPLIDKSIYDWCVEEILALYSASEEQDKDKQRRIKEIEKELSVLNKDTKWNKRQYNRLTKRLSKIKKSIGGKVSFGGKSNLREITRLKNKVQNETDEKILSELQTRLNIVESKYKTQREQGLWLIGRACEKGNRKVEFHLDENRIILKLNRSTHIAIEFINTNKRNIKLLNKLQQMAANKEIPISVRIFKDHVQFVFDEEKAAGYAFDETAFQKEREKCGKMEINAYKILKQSFFKEQEARMLLNKVSGRYISVDLNPCGIGYIIADYISEKEIHVIEKAFIEFSALSKRISIDSDHPKQIKQNNRRKTMICEIWKLLFAKAEHYKIAHFISENLNFKFKDKNYDEATKEFNRKRRNIWHLTLTKQLIAKYCHTLGIKHIEVNPCYSSFIGNISYSDYDAIAAAKELLRRGILKFIKGHSLYPSIQNEIIREKLCYLLGEKSLQEGVLNNWAKAYKEVSSAKLRYRNMNLKLMKFNYLNTSHKKDVKIYGQINREIYSACL